MYQPSSTPHHDRRVRMLRVVPLEERFRSRVGAIVAFFGKPREETGLYACPPDQRASWIDRHVQSVIHDTTSGVTLTELASMRIFVDELLVDCWQWETCPPILIEVLERLSSTLRASDFQDPSWPLPTRKSLPPAPAETEPLPQSIPQPSSVLFSDPTPTTTTLHSFKALLKAKKKKHPIVIDRMRRLRWRVQGLLYHFGTEEWYHHVTTDLRIHRHLGKDKHQQAWIARAVQSIVDDILWVQGGSISLFAIKAMHEYVNALLERYETLPCHPHLILALRTLSNGIETSKSNKMR